MKKRTSCEVLLHAIFWLKFTWKVKSFYLFIYKVVEISCDSLATSLKRSLNVLTIIVHPWRRLSHVISFDQLQQRGDFAIAYK